MITDPISFWLPSLTSCRLDTRIIGKIMSANPLQTKEFFGSGSSIYVYQEARSKNQERKNNSQSKDCVDF